MERKDIVNQSIKEMKVRSSGYAWIPKHIFYSSEKVLSVIAKCKTIKLK